MFLSLVLPLNQLWCAHMSARVCTGSEVNVSTKPCNPKFVVLAKFFISMVHSLTRKLLSEAYDCLDGTIRFTGQ